MIYTSPVEGGYQSLPKLQKNRKFIFLALAPTGNGISGSDRIFIELARQWSKKVEVQIVTTYEGVNMCSKQKLLGKYLKVVNIKKILPNNFYAKYFYKIYLGVKYSIQNPVDTNDIVYSSSDFLMDVLPAVLFKIRGKKFVWVATWFQTAPNPLKGFKEIKRDRNYTKSAFFYWASQILIKPFIAIFADLVIVNNQSEIREFPKLFKKNRVYVLIGAVRMDEINKFLKKNKNKLKKYDAVFQGRFHPQKGVVELIEIWEKVVRKVPKAKLVMIGDGPLMEDVKKKVEILKLQRNIELKGYVFDGKEKYKIFSASKLVVHPAFFDSGGMASAEAMAFGIPCVGFNLKAYDSYYPKGMVKVKNGSIEGFAKEILKLIGNIKTRKKIGKQAKDMIKLEWSWQHRASNLKQKIDTL